MVFNVWVKFHENMSSDFNVMERTRKLLTDTHTHTHRKDENIIPPWHTSYAGGIIIFELSSIPLLICSSVYRLLRIHTQCMQITKTLLKLHGCPGRSELLGFSYVRAPDKKE